MNLSQIAAAFITLFTMTLMSVNFSSQADTLNLGAKYIAQGGAILANGNDVFAMSVNPANALTHGNNSYIEIAASLSAYQVNNNEIDGASNFKTEINTMPFLGISYAKNWYSLGYVMQSFGDLPSFSYGRNGQLQTDMHSLHKTSVAFGIGNVLDDKEQFTYGIGVVLELFEGDLGSNRRYKGSGNTYSFKSAYQANKVFSRHNIGLRFAFAGSYSDQVSPELINADNVSLRPEVLQIGTSIELTHLNNILPWNLSISADLADAKSEQELLTRRFILGQSQRIGVEFRAINALGSNRDISLRLGNKSYADLDSNFSSAGIGFNLGKWFFDVSGNQDEFAEGELAYHLSLTRTF